MENLPTTYSIKKSRNSSVELLRFFFMYLILLIHIYGHGTGLDFGTMYKWGANAGTAIHLSLFSLGNIGVTGFIFISGYYGIHLNRYKVIDLVMTTFFYLLILFPLGNNVSPLMFLHPFDGWWFVSAYLFLMFLAPIIELGIKAISPKTFRNIVISLLLYTYFAKAITLTDSHDVILLITVYLTARYCMLNKFYKLREGGRCIGIIAVLLLMSIPVVASMIGMPEKFFRLFVQNNNPLLLIIAGWLVYEADMHTFKSKVINKLMAGTLAIYLITDASNVRPLLTPALLPSVMQGVGFIYIFVISIGCLLVDRFRSFLFDVIRNCIIRNKQR